MTLRAVIRHLPMEPGAWVVVVEPTGIGMGFCTEEGQRLSIELSPGAARQIAEGLLAACRQFQPSDS